jgi:hypothetical protein
MSGEKAEGKTVGDKESLHRPQAERDAFHYFLQRKYLADVKDQDSTQ